MKLVLDQTKHLWASPDGEKQLYEVTDQDGIKYLTWSQTIGEAAPGAEFTCVTYQKEDKRGNMHTYVKQEPKDNYLPKNFGSKPTVDVDKLIIRQVALKCAVEFGKTLKLKITDTLNAADAFDAWINGEKKPDNMPKPDNLPFTPEEPELGPPF